MAFDGQNKKICIVTATRAEYGILSPLIKQLRTFQEWEIQLVVTGTHLAEEFGNTYQEIEQDGVPIFAKIPILEKGDDGYAVSCTMANALRGFGAYFKKEKPNLLLILGDRTEMLAVAAAAMNAQVPIGHLHGGELTQGAVDDCVRHAITKMSYLHFASAEEYRRRIIQMGEEPSRVFDVGALGVENILNEKLLTRRELNLDLPELEGKDYAVVTFHPVTLEASSGEGQLRELMQAMVREKGLFYLITKANADAGGRSANLFLEQEIKKYPHMKLVDSLGMKRYLSAVQYARLVLGNSSSGIIEAPALGTPTVNIGDRQKGRLMGESIICCPPRQEAIVDSIRKALDMGKMKGTSPYGDGSTSRQIADIIQRYFAATDGSLKKKFYDILETENK
ncbi:MAG: UDP-N-acetylglucosamine 2-epimerase (hydrolyzing) [Lachnospiraceae bacterium]|nr:UDP-N-acetylglucosamine 2-epimerase (hydrolyzing) [Lachnospiraceae bacterium]